MGKKRKTATSSPPILQVDDNILQIILSKLPAKSFASAACVNRAWNDICTRILFHPIFSSAISSNTSLSEAVNEVTDKVLSAPIRPHFATLTICPGFDLDEAHKLITEKLGSKTPIITCDSTGVMGRDAKTDRFSEVIFPYSNIGISLAIGYLPGLRVAIVPLVDTEEGHNTDNFVVSVRRFSASVSGCSSPEAIIMFGDSEADMKPVLEMMDCGLSQKAVIAGNESCNFRHSSIDTKMFLAHRGKELSHVYAVALVFARERTTLDGLGKIEFHFAVGAGVSAAGPTYKVVSAKMRSRDFTTWLTAKREGENEILDGEEMLNDFELEMGDPVLNYDLYIGVRKRRKYSIGREKVKTVTSVAYHLVHDADEQYLYVGGLDIKTGDSFRFYVPDKEYALDSFDIVSENFGKLKHKNLIGGFVFACSGRGEKFFAKPNADSSPILDNFSDIPLAGMFCSAEVGRGSPNLGAEKSSDSHLHIYSSIYLFMSYSLPTSRP